MSEEKSIELPFEMQEPEVLSKKEFDELMSAIADNFPYTCS